MAKKQILFVINNLNVGGAEKALLSLLQDFNYEMYDVDVLLFKKEGLFLKQLPREVNIIEEPENYRYFDMPFRKVLEENIWPWQWAVILRRLQFSWEQRRALSAAQREQFGWRAISATLKPLIKNYDIAIGYLQSVPNYFVKDKVYAKKKIAYIHNDYKASKLSVKYDDKMFKAFAQIVSVSNHCVNILTELFPQHSEKFVLVENFSSPELITKLSKAAVNFNPKDISLVSVGRLAAQKNFKMAIEAAKILQNWGIDFEWNVIGDGPDRVALKQLIANNNLHDVFKLIGIQANPYPFISRSLIYVQPSLFEGKSIAVDEAKILQKPIVVTNFATAADQIKHNITGLVAEMNAGDLATKLLDLIKNQELRNELSRNLSAEHQNRDKNIEQFYHLIEN